MTIHLDRQIILVDKNTETTYTGKVFNTLHKTISDGVSGNFYDYKIIAANPSIADLPLLPLPDVKDDEVEKMANIESERSFNFPYCDFQGKRIGIDDEHTGQALRGAYCQGFEQAYKAAKENTFTKEDMIEFGEFMRKEKWAEQGNAWLAKVNKPKDFLQLYLDQKPKPQFIPEMENNFSYTGLRTEQQLKIVDGKMVGKWEYDINQ